MANDQQSSDDTTRVVERPEPGYFQPLRTQRVAEQQQQSPVDPKCNCGTCPGRPVAECAECRVINATAPVEEPERLSHRWEARNIGVGHWCLLKDGKVLEQRDAEEVSALMNFCDWMRPKTEAWLRDGGPEPTIEATISEQAAEIERLKGTIAAQLREIKRWTYAMRTTADAIKCELTDDDGPDDVAKKILIRYAVVGTEDDPTDSGIAPAEASEGSKAWYDNLNAESIARNEREHHGKPAPAPAAESGSLSAAYVQIGPSNRFCVFGFESKADCARAIDWLSKRTEIESQLAKLAKYKRDADAVEFVENCEDNRVSPLKLMGYMGLGQHCELWEQGEGESFADAVGRLADSLSQQTGGKV